jgi:hypothetical protein
MLIGGRAAVGEGSDFGLLQSTELHVFPPRDGHCTKMQALANTKGQCTSLCPNMPDAILI